MKKKVAIAIFVKTPKFSSCKSRLAKTIGTSAAVKFHLFSSNIVGETVSSVTQAQGFWSIAELEAMDGEYWGGGLKKIHQGKGSLGERLDRVYQTLSQDFEKVIFLGADCPQVEKSQIDHALKKLEKADFVFGPSEDGGFYLFGGAAPISREIWNETRYSESDTLAQISRSLKSIGSVEIIESLFDVDHFDEFKKLGTALGSFQNLTPKKKELLNFIDHLVEEQEAPPSTQN
ncbi:MAG: DUF2064 domain-containing protein [Bacteriovoracaceae bacterium]|jgi:uncharacterized protein|nr:DUF2064 domain-containing protein [Bacteriovoracaceae bacterium]